MGMENTPAAVNSDKLLEFEQGLFAEVDRQNEDEGLYADLTSIFVEIIRVVAKTDSDKTPVIFDYAKLLQQEIQLHSCQEAYIVGCASKDVPIDTLLKTYQLKIDCKRHPLDTRIRQQHDEIALLLGDCYGLVDEFAEAYQRVHGAVKNNLAEFIRLGQISA